MILEEYGLLYSGVEVCEETIGMESSKPKNDESSIYMRLCGENGDNNFMIQDFLLDFGFSSGLDPNDYGVLSIVWFLKFGERFLVFGTYKNKENWFNENSFTECKEDGVTQLIGLFEKNKFFIGFETLGSENLDFWDYY
ncbi:hypothetical protein FQA39_LY15615 [Lamprigera yunnana]|nr:hypothetical protein FQA39_LY15615 [Lamprigera yunnana]